jgi:hypothetical protein
MHGVGGNPCKSEKLRPINSSCLEEAFARTCRPHKILLRRSGAWLDVPTAENFWAAQAKKMSLYHEAAEILTSSSQEGGSLKSRVFGRKNIKSTPNQLYALVLESCKWSAILKEVIHGAELLKFERKVSCFLLDIDCHSLMSINILTIFFFF